MRHCGARRLLLDERNNPSPRPALSLSCGGENCFHVKAVLGGLLLAKVPHLVHNVIIGHGSLSYDSSSAQQQGGPVATL